MLDSRHFVPLNTLQTIYKSVISSYLSYGIVAWGQAAKTHADQLFLLQKRACRLIYFGHYTAYAIPYFLSSNILPLNMLYFKTVAILMHDITNKVFYVYSTPLIKYTLTTLDPRQDVIIN